MVMVTMKSSTDKDQTLPSRVGKYELGKTLGSGNFAKVKYARHVDTGKPFAIKIMDKDKILKQNICHIVKREISIMKRLKHPNILELHEVLANKTKIFLVLEYASGGHLLNKISKQRKLKEEEASKYFHQLIDAVDYCHSRGVYHRDLKPENLLLDSDGNLKVSDFGLSALSQQFWADGLLHTTCGTPEYMAPEVICVRQGYDGAKADVWSCGVILYVLLTGRLPFNESSMPILLKKIYKADFICPPDLSPAAVRLINRILTPNPKNRINVNQIFQSSWFRKGYENAKCNIMASSLQDKTKTVINVDDVEAAFMSDQRIDSDQASSDSIKEHDMITKPALMNAFDLIASLNKGPDFSNMLVKQGEEDNQQINLEEQDCEFHFTSNKPALEIMSRLEDITKPLGFSVKKSKCKLKLLQQDCISYERRGQLSIEAEVFEIASSLYLVELRKTNGARKACCDIYQSFSSRLKDMILCEVQ